MRIDNSVPADGAQRGRRTGEAPATPLSLKEGDVIQARVISFKDGMVQLKIQEGQTIQGEMLPGTQLEQGQTVKLQVVGQQGEMLVLQVARNGQDVSAQLKGALTRMGLEPNAENLNIAQMLADRGVPLRISTIQLARTIIQNYPDMSADKVAFFASNGIQPDAQMIAALDRMMLGENSGSILKEVWSQFSAMPDFPQAQGAAVPQQPGGIQVLIQGLADALGNARQPGAETVQAPGEAALPQAPPASRNEAAPRQAQQAAPNTPAGQAPDTQAAANAAQGAAEAIPAAAGPEVTVQPGKTAVAGSISGDQTASAAGQAVNTASEQVQATQSNSTAANAQTVRATAPANVTALMPETIQALTQGTLSNEMASLVVINAYLPEHEAAQRVAQFVQHMGDDISPAVRQEIHALLDTLQQAVRLSGQTEANILHAFSSQGKDAVLQILERMFARIQAQYGDSAQQLRDGVENSATRLLALHTAVNRSGREGAPALAQHVENLAQNMRVMDAAAQFVYVQIPISLQDQRQTAQLYVLKREGGRRVIDPENATLLIALDTENLGRVESLVKIEQKSVTLSVRMEQEDCLNYVKGHTVELYSAIHESGFKLQDLRFMLIGTPVNPVNVNQVVEMEYTPQKGIMDIKI